MDNKQKYIFTAICIFDILFLFAVIVDVILPIPRAFQAILVIISNSFYLTKYRSSNSQAYSNKTTPFVACYKTYLLLLISQILITIPTSISTSLLAASLLLIVITFWNMLKRTYNNTNSIISIISPYIYISKYVMIASVIVFVALLLGIASLTSFSIDPTKYEMFNGNYEIGGYSIYNPLKLVFVGGSDRGIKFFGQFGPFLGLCHEPHLSTYLISPALFMMLAYNKKKILWIILFIVNILLAGSVTNIILGAICLFIYFILENKYFSPLNKHLSYIAFFTFVLLCVMNYSDIAEKVGLEIVSTKMQSGNLSYDTSSNILSYMYNPQSLFGTGILVYCYNPIATDIGFISFLLNIIFQISFVYGIITVCLYGNRQAKIIGVGLLYFALHTLKIGQMVYQFPYLIFILFIGHIILISKNDEQQTL